MFEYFFTILIGLIQGVTEFLPISSSGHLVVFHRFIQLPIKNELAFDVMLHLATLLAVVIYFRKEIIVLARAWFNSWRGKGSRDSQIAWLLLVSAFPAAVVGAFFKDIIEFYLRSPLVVAIMLVVGAILFLIAERIGKRTRSVKQLGLIDALMIGLAQVLALVPGTSRSGITIIAGLFIGLKRESAVKFSFLMSIPIVFGAGMKNIFDLDLGSMAGNELYILAVASLVSFAAGYAAINYLLKFVKNNSFFVFALYRIILAIIVISLIYWF
jgi:undecaprenyl-diphosphatase